MKARLTVVGEAWLAQTHNEVNLHLIGCHWFGAYRTLKSCKEKENFQSPLTRGINSDVSHNPLHYNAFPLLIHSCDKLKCVYFNSHYTGHYSALFLITINSLLNKTIHINKRYENLPHQQGYIEEIRLVMLETSEGAGVVVKNDIRPCLAEKKPWQIIVLHSSWVDATAFAFSESLETSIVIEKGAVLQSTGGYISRHYKHMEKTCLHPDKLCVCDAEPWFWGGL